MKYVMYPNFVDFKVFLRKCTLLFGCRAIDSDSKRSVHSRKQNDFQTKHRCNICSKLDLDNMYSVQISDSGHF